MNISKYTSQELHQLRKDIDKELRRRRKDDLKHAQREIKTVAEKYGFAIGDLVGASPARRGGGKGVVRFQNPSDPSKTWSGRGRKPAWIKEWEASGRSLDELQVG